MQFCLTKLSVILEIDPYNFYSIFFNERIIAATSNFQGMSEKNDSLLQIEEIVRIYSSSWIEMNDGYFLFWLSIYREYVYSAVVYQKYLTRLRELVIFEPWRENSHFSQPS